MSTTHPNNLTDPANLKQWWDEMINLPQGGKTSRFDRVAYLYMCYGSWKVTTWNSPTTNRTTGPRGLPRREAIELCQWSALLDGLSLSGIDWKSYFNYRYTTYTKEMITKH